MLYQIPGQTRAEDFAATDIILRGSATARTREAGGRVGGVRSMLWGNAGFQDKGGREALMKYKNSGQKKTGSPVCRRLSLLLLVLSVLAALKMIFFAVGLDEEYQLVMAYRNARGDRLFLDMWEPHQSSAFLCTLLMKPWLALFGTTGVVLYLRFCGTLLHLAVSFYLYRVLEDFLDEGYARLLGLIYFNIIPKQIILPEFGIMQVWFYTLMALFLARYYFCGRKRGYLALASLSLVLNVLSYPSCLILFPFLLALCARFSGKNRWRDMGIVTLCCVLCALAYLGMLFTYTTPRELLETLSHILSGDVTHSLTFGGKMLSLGWNMLYLGVLWGGCVLLSLEAAKWKGLRRETMWCLTVVFACGAELFYWFVLGYGYERMQIHLVAFALAGLGAAWGRRLSGHAAGVSNPFRLQNSRVLATADQHRMQSFLLYLMAGALLSLIAVIYLTDLSLIESIPHALPAAFCGVILLLSALGTADADTGGTAGTAMSTETAWTAMPTGTAKAAEYARTVGTAPMAGGEKTVDTASGAGSPKTLETASSRADTVASGFSWAHAVLFAWCFTAVLGKGYTLRSGTGGYHNVLQSGGILREGPAAGTISNYIGAYIYNCDYEDWQAYLQDGDRVLIQVDQVMNLGTIQYLFRDVDISHFSIVNPTAYDERLLEYWEMYPEKYPNVIIVDCWYGQLMTEPEGWLMRYIENEFGYTQVHEGRYIRVYRR